MRDARDSREPSRDRDQRRPSACVKSHRGVIRAASADGVAVDVENRAGRTWIRKPVDGDPTAAEGGCPDDERLKGLAEDLGLCVDDQVRPAQPSGGQGRREPVPRYRDVRPGGKAEWDRFLLCRWRADSSTMKPRPTESCAAVTRITRSGSLDQGIAAKSGRRYKKEDDMWRQS